MRAAQALRMPASQSASDDAAAVAAP